MYRRSVKATTRAALFLLRPGMRVAKRATTLAKRIPRWCVTIRWLRGEAFATLQMRGKMQIVIPIILLAMLAQSVHAEVRIGGGADAMTVEARDAPVEEVLSRLRARFGLRYRNSASLDRRVNGTYHGSLEHVVRRLLEGYDFV